MKIIEKIKNNRILVFLRTTPLLVAKNFFSASMFLFALSAIIIFFILLNYNIIFYSVDLNEMGDICSLDQEVYTNIKSIWENDARVFESVSSRDYYDIFD